jgi:general secretion pathway protein B
MSLILDALKKLDHEKSSRCTGTTNIASEILKADRPRSRKANSLYLVAGFLTAVATAIIAYGLFAFLLKPPPPLMQNPPASDQQVAPSPREPDAPSNRSPAPAVSSGPLTHAASRPKPGGVTMTEHPVPLNSPNQNAQIVAPPLRHEPERAEKIPAPPTPGGSTESTRTAVATMEKKPAPNKIAEHLGVAPGDNMTPPEPIQKESDPAPPSLRLSGIVWNAEAAERRAVINGTVVKEGADIDGVKIAEIYPNHVRFLHDGRYFEITISP